MDMYRERERKDTQKWDEWTETDAIGHPEQTVVLSVPRTSSTCLRILASREGGGGVVVGKQEKVQESIGSNINVCS